MKRVLRVVDHVGAQIPFLVLLGLALTLQAPVNLTMQPWHTPLRGTVVGVSPSPAVAPPAPHRATRSLSRPPLTVLNLSVTCYLPTGHRTASGAWPQAGMAAGNRWPIGTRLQVPEWGTVTVTDRIGWGSDLDLFMTDRSACLRWGRRALRVTVLP